jgi:hypothetical protein
MFSSNTSQVSNDATYIEDVFSTWLYTGNGSTQTITNGIDLSGKGGLVWVKARDFARDNNLFDTERGVNNRLVSNATGAQITTGGLTAFTSSGFTVDASAGQTNATGQLTASWTFRKQPKFFDVVTYTGNGAANRAIPHSLTSAPGCIIVKSTSNVTDWRVYHRSTWGTGGGFGTGILNSTGAFNQNDGIFSTSGLQPTSDVFYVDGTYGSNSTNASGFTYVAYLFAHNAGGFGLTGTDNVISCGSFTTDGSGNATVDLGYEPQYLMHKLSSGSQNWQVADVMRGFDQSTLNRLAPNTSGAETNTAGNYLFPTATGFQGNAIFSASSTYIYIAIRRGPMKTPTTGTEVFAPYEVPASPTTGAITGFVTDAGFIGQRAGSDKFYWGARLMGNPTLNSTNTNAESANTNQIWDRMNGWWNSAINGYMTWGFRRAPGFFDVVCYTGTGSATTFAHNLAAVPELMIVKKRSLAAAWIVYSSSLGGTKGLQLNGTSAQITDSTYWNNTDPTSSVFTVGTSAGTNSTSGNTFVAYLFASCPGVSKVGSFTGTGATQVIDCGFTGGARFVLIKATSTTGDWYVWDSARGIVAGNDPYLRLNSTAAEVTNTDWVDTAASGFELSNAGGNLANSNGVSYIFLAIA